MSNRLENGGRGCLKSAGQVANMVRMDDIVIFLWSRNSSTRTELFNFLAGPTHDWSWWKFVPQKVRHPTSGAQILLVSMPNADEYFMFEKKQGFRRILNQMDKAGVKFSTHIWVHNISNFGLLTNGMPTGWDSLKEIFEGDVKVEMDNVTFLSIRWENVSLEEGHKQEQGIRTALKSDVERGLEFDQLFMMDKDEAWGVIDNIVRNRPEDRRVRVLQHELDELYAELEKTEYGRGVRARFRRADDDQKRIMEPLLVQLGSEGLEPKEKEELERKVEEEYHLCLRDFRGHFAEVRAMGIRVGYNLREFYGLREPVQKKRFGLF